MHASRRAVSGIFIPLHLGARSSVQSSPILCDRVGKYSFSWSGSPVSGGVSSPPSSTEELLEMEELLDKHKKRQTLQPYWQNFERRITSRKPRRDGKSGRSVPRKTEEDYWLSSGAYDAMGAPTRRPPDDTASSVDGEESKKAGNGAKGAAAASGQGADAYEKAQPGASSSPNSSPVTAAAAATTLTVVPTQAMQDGLMVRHAKIPVHGRGTVAALVWSYRNEVQPVLRRFPGFQRVLLLEESQNGGDGTDGDGTESDVSIVHSISVWKDEGSLLRAMANPEYEEAMSQLRKFFQPDEVPAVSELTLLADLTPEESSNSSTTVAR